MLPSGTFASASAAAQTPRAGSTCGRRTNCGNRATWWSASNLSMWTTTTDVSISKPGTLVCRWRWCGRCFCCVCCFPKLSSFRVGAPHTPHTAYVHSAKGEDRLQAATQLVLPGGVGFVLQPYGADEPTEILHRASRSAGTAHRGALCRGGHLPSLDTHRLINWFGERCHDHRCLRIFAEQMVAPNLPFSSRKGRID